MAPKKSSPLPIEPDKSRLAIGRAVAECSGVFSLLSMVTLRYPRDKLDDWQQQLQTIAGITLATRMPASKRAGEC